MYKCYIIKMRFLNYIFSFIFLSMRKESLYFPLIFDLIYVKEIIFYYYQLRLKNQICAFHNHSLAAFSSINIYSLAIASIRADHQGKQYEMNGNLLLDLRILEIKVNSI